MNLKDDKQQNIQKQLDFAVAPTGEAREANSEETESSGAKNESEKPASTDRIMEEICEWENLKEAMWRVKTNKGSAGIDGMTVDELPDYPAVLVIREHLLRGTYEPQPVKRVEIPKPDGGVRKLGIPTALDRFVQQAVMQVLQQQWDRTFSDSSYGFRPGRSTHQAVAQAQQYIAAGHGWVVDLDLEKFFDRVNHDKLMGQIAKRVEDKRLLKLIRAFLNAGNDSVSLLLVSRASPGSAREESCVFRVFCRLSFPRSMIYLPLLSRSGLRSSLPARPICYSTFRLGVPH